MIYIKNLAYGAQDKEGWGCFYSSLKLLVLTVS